MSFKAKNACHAKFLDTFWGDLKVGLLNIARGCLNRAPSSGHLNARKVLSKGCPGAENARKVLLKGSFGAKNAREVLLKGSLGAKNARKVLLKGSFGAKAPVRYC